MVSDPYVGRIIDDRYQVIERIAAGGMATVYRARALRLDRDVALKVMHGHLAVDADFVKRFESEARQAARLNHTNIVQVFDQGVDSQGVYLVMELVDGQSLREVLHEHGPASLGQALGIVTQVLEALSVAHAQGIVHRDIKPENIMIAHGAVKVTDFGIARAMTDSRITKSGEAIGTVGYMAPELIMTGTISPALDVYAVGVMLFELLCGRFPFTGENAVQVALQQTSAPFPQLRDSIPWMPPEVDQLIAGMTNPNPALRYPTAAQALQALHSVAALLSPQLLAQKAPRAPEYAPVTNALQPKPGPGIVTQAREQRALSSQLARVFSVVGAFAVAVVVFFAVILPNLNPGTGTPSQGTTTWITPPSEASESPTAAPSDTAEPTVNSEDPGTDVTDTTEPIDTTEPVDTTEPTTAGSDPQKIDDNPFGIDADAYFYEGTTLVVKDTSPSLKITNDKQLPEKVLFEGGIPHLDLSEYVFEKDTKITMSNSNNAGQPMIYVPPGMNVTVKWTDASVSLNDGLDNGKRAPITETSGSRKITPVKDGPRLTIVLKNCTGIIHVGTFPP